MSSTREYKTLSPENNKNTLFNYKRVTFFTGSVNQVALKLHVEDIPKTNQDILAIADALFKNDSDRIKHEIFFTHNPSPTASQDLEQFRISNKMYNGLVTDILFTGPVKEETLMKIEYLQKKLEAIDKLIKYYVDHIQKSFVITQIIRDEIEITALMIERYTRNSNERGIQDASKKLDTFLENQKKEQSYATQKHFKKSSRNPLKPIENILESKDNKSANLKSS